MKKSVLIKFAKFTGKHLAQLFPCEFCEIFKNSFFHRTPPVAASGIGSISRPRSPRNHKAVVDQAIAMNSYQSYFKKLDILSGKQQGAITTDRKVYCLLLYDFCMVVTIFKVATSLSIFPTTRPSLAQ